jgi:putative ABC transport system substrate-binding protein
VNVIVARGLTIRAAREATATLPIVMAANPDPVRSGFVVSLARPGGNITGFSTLAPDLEAKQLELLREALPSLGRVGVLANANSPSTEETTRLEAATRALHFVLSWSST